MTQASISCGHIVPSPNQTSEAASVAAAARGRKPRRTRAAAIIFRKLVT